MKWNRRHVGTKVHAHARAHRSIYANGNDTKDKAKLHTSRTASKKKNNYEKIYEQQQPSTKCGKNGDDEKKKRFYSKFFDDDFNFENFKSE